MKRKEEVTRQKIDEGGSIRIDIGTINVVITQEEKKKKAKDKTEANCFFFFF